MGRKNIISIGLVIICILSMAGCSAINGVLGGGGEEVTGASVIEEPSNAEIADEVLWSFYAMCKIPHVSGNEGELSAYLEYQIEKMGLHCIRDAQNNIIADVPATPGLEKAPLTILQGHMDMVAATDDINAANATLKTVSAIVTNAIVQSDKTSALGADCGVGNAAVLYLAGRTEFIHGPLRLIFTTGGEDYMDGANAVDDMYLQDAKYLINVTGFQTGTILAGSAAGRRETYQMPLATAPVVKSRAVKIEMKGFTGGHYGGDMWRGRANPIKLMADLLARVDQSVDFQLIDWKAGSAVDSIPSRCEAVIALDQYDSPAFETILYDVMYEMKEKYGKTEPNAAITYSVAQKPKTAWSEDCKEKTIRLVNGFFDGVYSLPEVDSDDMAFLEADMRNEISASANVERIGIRSGSIRIVQAMKSDIAADMQALVSHNANLNQSAGFMMRAEEVQAWPLDENNNRLITVMSEAYTRRTGEAAHVMSGHTDLEIPVFLKKNPQIHAVAVGPDIIGAHTVNEYVRIESIGPFVKTLASALRDIATQAPEE